MKHLKTFEKYSYGEYDLTEEGLKDFARKAVIGGAMAASLIGSPQKAQGQIGHKIKDFVKSEITKKQSNVDLPEVGKPPIHLDLDESGIAHLNKKLDKEGFETINPFVAKAGRYIMTTTISNTESAAQLQTTQMMKGEKHGNVFHYVKKLDNGKIQMISISQIGVVYHQ
jgi:hypothetical protein